MSINPKCLNGMSCFISAEGDYYPCCFVYTNKAELEEWATKRNYNMSDISITKHGYENTVNSDFYKDFYNSFEVNTCTRECGEKGYKATEVGKPKWEKWKNTDETKSGV